VTPLGVRMPIGAGAPRLADPRPRLGAGRFILAVAQKRAYKRLDTLIRALPDLGPDTGLVLAGPPGDAEPELRALAGELGVAQRVHFLDWVADEDLTALYAHASCFALPSLIEGFGLPVLEAMAQGVPVACANRWSLPEVAGDAAVLFDPEDQAAVTSALERLLGDSELAARLRAAGTERARSYTWERTARATLESYHRATRAG
jgi:glycosyltransferase involved in cell wall biosynthesis